MRVGIFGGTFNPIHWGHLVLAETARDALTLERVLFIPARQPPHKHAAALLPGRVRLAMIRLAIRDHPAFVASEIELERPGVSYAIDTVKIIRGQLPDATLFLLIGQDMLAVRWVGWTQLKRLCTVVVARRPSRPRARPHTKGVGVGTRLRWLEMPRIDIASSEIRARLRGGQSIRYLVPRPVERYIRQHHLYQR